MFKQKPFLFSLLVLVILITLHIVGSYYSWYWLYPQFDIVVHFFSGLWVALLILWLFSCLGQINSLKEYKIKSFLVAFTSAVLIGVVWEILEVMSHITYTDASNYNLNTASDIISDAMGGILAYIYFIKRNKRVDNSTDLLHPFYNQTGIIKK